MKKSADGAASLREELAAQQAGLKMTQEELKAAGAEKASASAEVKNLQAKIQQMTVDHEREVKDKNVSLTDEVKVLTKEKEDLQKGLVAEQDKSQKLEAAKKQAEDSWKNQTDSLRRKLQDSNQALEKKVVEINQHKEHTKNAADEATTLRGELAARNAELKMTQEKLKAAGAEKASSSAEAEKLRMVLEQMTAEHNRKMAVKLEKLRQTFIAVLKLKTAAPSGLTEILGQELKEAQDGGITEKALEAFRKDAGTVAQKSTEKKRTPLTGRKELEKRLSTQVRHFGWSRCNFEFARTIGGHLAATTGDKERKRKTAPVLP